MTTGVSTEAERRGTEPPAASAGPTRVRRRRRALGGRALPYLLIAPALVFELLVHVVPMLTGVAISFLKLNQFYLRHWLQAPFAGLDNYRSRWISTARLAPRCCDPWASPSLSAWSWWRSAGCSASSAPPSCSAVFAAGPCFGRFSSSRTRCRSSHR
ncbi:hypothetical protein [Fodinicola feengrottensis]|uniref:hypothetical protein n=1 Tax=Fodinicola feengrottensis TaxID=435914 RepID=UPI0024435268|nr:hypothetical protein [Fodinicola feengrottensis]